MKFRKFLLIIFILPVTLILDLILYSLAGTCPACGSFWQWIGSEGALSFPLVVGFYQWFERLLIDLKVMPKKQI